jgi:histidinol-phosphate aminotransferase
LPEDVDEQDVVRGLAERQVLVRAGTSLGREGAMRVTVGTDPENARFVAALTELLGLESRAPSGKTPGDDH